MLAKKYKSVITPTGTAVWAHLNTPDKQFDPGGVFHVTLRIPKDDAGEVVKLIKSTAKSHITHLKGEKPTVKVAPLPFKAAKDQEGNPTGELEFKFKMRATGGQGQDQWSQRPKLFDSNKKIMSEKIGHGSKIQVAGEIVPYDSPNYGAGVSLRLKAVQVIELREYSESGDSWGFEKQDGFTTKTSNGDSETVEASSSDDVEFDFN